MLNPDDELTPTDELMATWGKWFNRIGLAVGGSAAVLGGVVQHWPIFTVGVLGILAFIFNRAVYRFIERCQTRK